MTLEYNDFFSSLANDAKSEERQEYAETMLEVQSFVEKLDPELSSQQFLMLVKKELSRRLRDDSESDESMAALQEALFFIEDELDSLFIDA